MKTKSRIYSNSDYNQYGNYFILTPSISSSLIIPTSGLMFQFDSLGLHDKDIIVSVFLKFHSATNLYGYSKIKATFANGDVIDYSTNEDDSSLIVLDIKKAFLNNNGNSQVIYLYAINNNNQPVTPSYLLFLVESLAASLTIIGHFLKKIVWDLLFDAVEEATEELFDYFFPNLFESA